MIVNSLFIFTCIIQVEAMLPNLKNTDIIQKAQELLNSAINLMPKVSEGPVKDSFAARIQKAQDAINVAFKCSCC